MWKLTEKLTGMATSSPTTAAASQTPADGSGIVAAPSAPVKAEEGTSSSTGTNTTSSSSVPPALAEDPILPILSDAYAEATARLSRASTGSVDEAKDQLIQTLTEELIRTKADLARITKERAYYKRKAEWATTEDQKILSPIIKTTDNWYERTWLLLHEPIRGALLDFEDLVMKTPSFDPVRFPWKVTNFFYYFKSAFAPFVRRHHEVEDKVYIPWIKTKVQNVPPEIAAEHDSLEQLLKDVEQSEVEYKALLKNGKPKETKDKKKDDNNNSKNSSAGTTPAADSSTMDSASPPPMSIPTPRSPLPNGLAPEDLYEWRSTLIMRLSVLSDALKQHMDQEEAFFPKVVSSHFTQKQEDAILEKMGSANTAHYELPMIVLALDVWGNADLKDEFLNKLSVAARQTLNHYWLSTYKKTVERALNSLALEEQPPASYLPLMSAPMLIAAAPIFLVCSIQ